MKFKYLFLLFLLINLVACEEDEKLIFDEPAEERASQAVQQLAQDLVQPQNGWYLQYRPNEESGLFSVILDFNQDGKVNIKTDVFANDGEFYDQTIPYRVDNSLGLELIFETYSFFSFLFELEQASFGGEFEFEYVNKTPDGALVFVSKTDAGVPTRIVMTPAPPNAEVLLGRQLSNNLNTLNSNLELFNPSLKLTFKNKDLAFFLKMNDFTRTMDITYVARKSDLSDGQELNFSSGFLIQGDTIALEQALTGSFGGLDYNLSLIELEELSEAKTEFCSGKEEETFVFNGKIPSTDDAIILETSLFDIKGQNVFQTVGFFISQVTPTSFIIDDKDSSAAPQIIEDLDGVQDMQLYYFAGGDDPFYAVGFRVMNIDQTNTWLLKRFIPEMEGNVLKFDFADTVTVFGNQNYQANADNIDKYLEFLSAQDNTHILQINENFYEFYNPCSGWRFIFQAVPE
ncbi:MAG: DUF4302 domain-containing protein [Candidatus Cyclobacteriaceae bacterium M3_2C_046]